jgi:hypothetical protein
LELPLQIGTTTRLSSKNKEIKELQYGGNRDHIHKYNNLLGDICSAAKRATLWPNRPRHSLYVLISLMAKAALSGFAIFSMASVSAAA